MYFQNFRLANFSSLINSQTFVIISQRWANEPVVKAALEYLHAIGNIVRFSEGRICLRPAQISQTLAKFVAPDEHKIDDTVVSIEGNKVLLDLKLSSKGERYSYQFECGSVCNIYVRKNLWGI